jgi:RNA polymerase sigma-70 factor (ECF subfamily)
MMKTFDNKICIEEQFHHVYSEFYKSFCFFANRYLKNPVQAEDIVSEVAIKVWEKRDSLQNAGALKNYFYTAIRNACFDALRKEKAMESRLTDFTSPAIETKNMLEHIIYSETMQKVESALHKLPPQCRKVFINLFIEGKSLAETAEEMQLSLSTIKNQRQRGIRLLRHSLIDHLLIFMIGATLALTSG